MQSVPNLEKIIWGWILWFPSIDSLPNRPRQRLLRPSIRNALTFRKLQTPSRWRVLGTYRSQKNAGYAYHIDVKHFQPSFVDIFWAKKNPNHHPSPSMMSLVLGSSYSRTTTTIRRHLGASLSLGGTLGYDGKDEGLKMTQMEESHKKSGRKLQFQKSSSSSTPNGETHRTGVGLKSFFYEQGPVFVRNFPTSSHLDVRVKAQKWGRCFCTFCFWNRIWHNGPE